MTIVCSECQFSNPKGAERCKRCKFPFDGEWPSLVGHTINNYKLVRRVGGGGFGAVYEARHVALGNAFAVKILHPRLAQDSAFTERFQREAHVLAELRHENVLQVIDFGFVEEVGFYLITEWLEGHSLFRVLRAHPRPERGWVWELFSQLLDALAYAHERGIVHRDLKPENLVITSGSRSRMVLKIVDFGIAQLVGGDHLEQGEQDTGRKRSRYAVGTPYYMAPEQVRGDVLLIGPHTDLYACGVILAEILTGQRPFEGGGQRETMRLQLEAFPPRLCELDPNGNFSENLESLVQRALQKDVESRFATAPEFGKSLDAAMKLSGVQPIVEDIYQQLAPKGSAAGGRPKRPKIVYRKKKQPGTSRLVWAFAVLAVLCVGGVAWIWMSLVDKVQTTANRKPPKRRKLVILAGGWKKFAASPDAGASAPDHPSAPQTDSAGDEPPGVRGSAQPGERTNPQPRPTLRRVRPRNRRNTRPRKPRRGTSRSRFAPRSATSPLILVRFLSKPSGAEVFLNGKRQGITPANLRIKQGSLVQVAFKKKGYVAKTISLKVTKTITRKITLIEDLF